MWYKSLKLSLFSGLALLFFVGSLRAPLLVKGEDKDEETEWVYHGKTKDEYSEDDYVVSLTFDDGPHPKYTPRILDLLDRYQVKATFFLIGENVEMYPDLVKEIHERGHQIGSHSYSHADLTTLSDEAVYEEIAGTAQLIEDMIDTPVTTYRLPYGSGDERVVSVLSDYDSVLWNVDSLDWGTWSGKAVYNNVVRGLTGRDLILFHDRFEQTVKALEILLPRLIEKGYYFDDPSVIDIGVEFF